MSTNTQRLVIDGVSYDWLIEDDPNLGDLGFSHRGADQPMVRIRGEDGTSISFPDPPHVVSHRGWWRGPHHVTPEVIERAVRIVLRNPAKKDRSLSDDEIDEALDALPRTLGDELRDIGAACASLAHGDDDSSRRALVRSLLAVGCQDWIDADITDNWVKSHSLQLVAASKRVQLLLTEDGKNEHVYRNRSAVAFLIDMCERNGIVLEIDTSQADAQLKTRSPERVRPWGIPESHWWWRQGALYDADPNDYD